MSNKKLESSSSISIPFSSSFFDDIGQAKPIWDITQNIMKTKIDLSVDCLLLQSIFYKRTKSESKWKKRYYFLYPEYMTYKREDGTFGKFLIFENIRLQYSLEQDNKKDVPFRFRFQFLKNKENSEIFTNDEKIYEQWKNKLLPKCILHSFHSEYQVTKMIGKGSFAKVFLAKKNNSNQDYAIKAFSKESLISQDKGRASLMNEINIMRKMDHKQIIKLHEVHETEHSLYLILDALTGGELVKKMKEKPYYNQEDIIKIMKNLLEALEHVHFHKIMHRDLKLENLLLRNEKDIDVVVVDFGLSSVVGLPVKEILFKRCGTPGFVAPEVLAYKDNSEEFYDEKCDIFSVGVILFILLTGRKPFAGCDYKEILKANRDCKVDYEKDDIKKLNPITLSFLKNLLTPLPHSRPSATEALSHPFFEKIKSKINQSELQKKNFVISLKQIEEEEEKSPQHYALKDYSIGKFSLSKNSHKDSVDAIANDLMLNKPYKNDRNSDLQILTNIQTYSSNLSIDTPKNRQTPTSKFLGRNDIDDIAESPKRFSKFYSKNEAEENGNQFSVGLRKKSMMSPSELHKLAIINNMKEKITNGIGEYDIPDENSPLQSNIKKYGGFEAKVKNN